MAKKEKNRSEKKKKKPQARIRKRSRKTMGLSQKGKLCMERKALSCWERTMVTSTNHGFIVEGEALHGAHGVSGAAHVLEDDKRLAAHLERLDRDDVEDLAELREDGVQ